VSGSIHAELRRARLAAALTQQQLAERMGVTRGGVAHIEMGRSEVSIESAERWASACGCRFAWTLTVRS
jgi:transcriptional regulator with XRE-family HTH domain